MCKLFTRGKIQVKLAQKLLSMVVSLSLLAGMVPLGRRNFVAEAELPGPAAIPQEMFMMKDELLRLCAETNGGTGLLATGTESDKKIRVVFGTRPQGVVKYYTDLNENTAEVGSDDGPTPMTWLIAGWDDAPNSNKPGLVLYSEKPMISAKALDSNSDSRFQVDTNYKNYTPENDSGYPNTNPIEVYSNHWGASNARAQLDALFTGDGWFTGGEKARMLSSRITTTDTKNSVDYTTEDTLYALNNTSVTAGEADELVIDEAYWGSRSWLRSPSSYYDYNALLALRGLFNPSSRVDSDDPATAAACKINLESVIFASAASAASSAAGGENFSQIDPNALMYLRLDGSTELAGAIVAANGTKLTYTAPAGSRLMVIATTEDGATYQFSHNVDTEVADETLDLADFAGDLLGQNVAAKAWIEKDVEDGGTLTYATEPIDITTKLVKTEDSETPETPGGSITPDDGTNQHPDWGEREVHGGITHYVNADGMTSVEISAENTDENGIVWLREESDGTAAWYGLDNLAGTFASGSRFYVQWLNTAEHPDAFADIDEETRQQVEENRGWLFRIGVIAPDGTRYSTLSNPVNVYVQIGDDWDKDDLQGFYIQQGADENVEVSYVEGWPYPEGTDEFGVMRLNHFSPYFIYDKDTEEEQNALNAVKTGDELTYVTISGLGLVMTLALGLMLNSKISRKNLTSKI